MTQLDRGVQATPETTVEIEDSESSPRWPSRSCDSSADCPREFGNGMERAARGEDGRLADSATRRLPSCVEGAGRSSLPSPAE